jgi:hypothetical protein
VSVDPRIMTGGALALGALLGYLANGAIPEERIHASPDGRTVSIDFDGTPPADTGCVWTGTFKATPGALALGRMRSDAGPQCGANVICASPSDEPQPPLGEDIVAATDTQHTHPYTGGPMFWAAIAGHPSLPCACSTGSGCEMYQDPVPEFGVPGGWAPAPLGETLQPGKWRTTDGGTGCYTRVCTEPEPGACWPAECPLTAPEGP